MGKPEGQSLERAVGTEFTNKDVEFTERGNGVACFLTGPSSTGSSRGPFCDCLSTVYVVGLRGSTDPRDTSPQC